MLANFTAPTFSKSSYITILNDIQNHPTLKFYITGSRFFGTAHHNLSDWDFFIQNICRDSIDVDIQQFLDEHGFRKVRDYTQDSETVAVFQSLDCMVHIQLVRDAKFKADIQSMIGEFLYTSNGEAIPKTIQRDIWNMAYKIGRAISNYNPMSDK